MAHAEGVRWGGTNNARQSGGAERQKSPYRPATRELVPLPRIILFPARERAPLLSECNHLHYFTQFIMFS
ncbi:hypothetical protein EP342_00150 [bacterium]|nr:MAG: hypothetical protein EP342_00150 [bacterium]